MPRELHGLFTTCQGAERAIEKYYVRKNTKLPRKQHAGLFPTQAEIDARKVSQE